MTHEEDIFEAAVALPETKRPAYLDAACAGNPEMRSRLEALLRSHNATGFMEENAVAADSPELGAEWSRSQLDDCGQHIGHYKLLEQIGEGGFGVVWVAEQLEPVRRRVAIKIIKPGMDSREVIARFGQERQALAMMDHPNIAKVFDAGATDKARPYFVMELVRGVRITDYCNEANLPTTARLKLFITVCQAVQHAHQKGIIHRDLKPSNILVSPGDDGQAAPKVIDFGVAKAMQQSLTDETVYTHFEQMIGTPAYMSPEQAGLGPIDIDTRSDVYSLGVLLYELLTGRPPFDPKELQSAGPDEMRRIICEVEPPKPSTRRTQLSAAPGAAKHAAKSSIRGPKSKIDPDLDWVVMKALEKDRNRRYETANGFAADIQRFLNDEPVSAGPPSAGYRLRKFATRNKVALSVTSAVAAVLVAATIISTLQAVRATKAEKLANQKSSDEKIAREDAEAIAGFLAEVFRSPQPGRDGYKITVAESLDSAAKKLDIELANQPYRRSKLQFILANTYSSLGLEKQAIPIWEKLRDYFATAYGSEDFRTINVLHSLGNSYAAAGRLTEALQLRESVLQVRLKTAGADHPATVVAMASLANSYEDAERHQDALALRKRALSLSELVFGAEAPETVALMTGIASSLFDTGSFDEALPLREKVLELRRKFRGPRHPDTIIAMSQLATSYHVSPDDNRKVAALRLREEVADLSRDVNGPEHPATLEEKNNLANSYAAAGRQPDALRLREEVLESFRGNLGTAHIHTHVAMQNLAKSYDAMGRLDDAIALDAEALQLTRDAGYAEHPKALSIISDLADYYSAAGQGQDALKLYEEELALSRKIYGESHRWTFEAMADLAACYSDAGRDNEALALMDEAVDLSRKLNGPKHRDTLHVMQDLASYYGKVGREDQSLKSEEEVLKLKRDALGPEDSDTLAAMTNLSISYRNAGRLDEAIPLQEKALALKRNKLPPGHPWTIVALNNLAECYAATGRNKDAEELKREAEEMSHKHSNLAQPAPKTDDEGRGKPLARPRASVPRASPDPGPSVAATTADSSTTGAVSGSTVPAKANALSTVSATIVRPDSEWRWLHPTDGVDPEKSFPGFHKSFPKATFDDSKWARGNDSDDPNGGFGYGLNFTGVSIGKPESVSVGHTAYFRYAFKTTTRHTNLELRCRRDDGIVIYLDGKEVKRDNMSAGPDAFLLPAKLKVEGGESEVHALPISGNLAPGTHLLAISVHNPTQPSSDLRLGGVTLVEIEAPEKAK